MAAFCSEDSVLRQWLSEGSEKGESSVSCVRKGPGGLLTAGCTLSFPALVSHPGWTDRRFPGPHAGSLPNGLEPHDAEHQPLVDIAAGSW